MRGVWSEIRLLAAPPTTFTVWGSSSRRPATRRPRHDHRTGRSADGRGRAKTLQAVPDPEITVAVGVFALGGIWSEDEFVHGAVDRPVPVDVDIPGCPPNPLALLQGLLVAVDRLEEKVTALNLEIDPERGT